MGDGVFKKGFFLGVNCQDLYNTVEICTTFPEKTVKTRFLGRFGSFWGWHKICRVGVLNTSVQTM